MHVKEVAEYRKNNAENLLPPEDVKPAVDQNIETFLKKSKMSGKPVKRQITQVHRRRIGNKEYFTYHQQLSSFDSLDNHIECWFPNIGKWEKPSFEYITNPDTGSKIATAVRNRETQYELHWPKDFTEEIQKDLTENVDLIVITSSRKYGGYDLEEFKKRSFDELVTYGKYGVFSKPVEKVIEIEDTRRREADKRNR